MKRVGGFQLQPWVCANPDKCTFLWMELHFPRGLPMFEGCEVVLKTCGIMITGDVLVNETVICGEAGV